MAWFVGSVASSSVDGEELEVAWEALQQVVAAWQQEE
jgi:hypothetical protein